MIFYSEVVKTEVKGAELQATAERMVRLFTKLVNMEYVDAPYPRWGDSMRQLMENAWVMAKWHAIIDVKTGRPMTMTAIARKLCHNLHMPLPANISAVAYRSRKTGRKSVVDYYAMLWREAKLGPEAMVMWEKPITFPKITSYRGLFK